MGLACPYTSYVMHDRLWLGPGPAEADQVPIGRATLQQERTEPNSRQRLMQMV